MRGKKKEQIQEIFSGPTQWDLPPEDDPVGLARSHEIDKWLRSERAKELKTSFKTLLLSPDNEQSDFLRERLFKSLGNELNLGGGCKTTISTFPIKKKDKKTIGAYEPSILLYIVDPGKEDDVLPRLKKALSHFLYTTRSLGLGPGCSVVIFLARSEKIKSEAHRDADNWEEWCSLFPSLTKGNSIMYAIQTEFHAAANTEAQPHRVAFAVHDDAFDDGTERSLLEQVLKDSHTSLVNSLMSAQEDDVNSPKLSAEKENPLEEKPLVTAQTAEKPSNNVPNVDNTPKQEEVPQHIKERREKFMGYLLDFIFLLEVILVLAILAWITPGSFELFRDVFEAIYEVLDDLMHKIVDKISY